MLKYSICKNNTISIMTHNRSIADLSSEYIPIKGIEGKVFFFHRIKVLPKHEGTGEGKELMIEVCKYADELNATIYNGLNPYGKRNLKSLKSFFKASGFEMFEEPNIMVRWAKEYKHEPYLIEEKIIKVQKYNPYYGDDNLCNCGHPYYRHFDSYDDMFPCGCKYCFCFKFEKGEIEN